MDRQTHRQYENITFPHTRAVIKLFEVLKTQLKALEELYHDVFSLNPVDKDLFVL